ncbi:MAG: ATP-binding protein [bacterium]|nr:ATP-binding protein [bacterium]
MIGGKPVLVDEKETRYQLVVIIEGADFLIPEGQLNAMSDAHLHRIAICRDWFSDLGFMEGGDTVVLIAESRSLLNQRVAQMPQLAEVTIPSPDETARLQFIRWFEAQRATAEKPAPKYWSTAEELARATAALSVHALRQLLVSAVHDGQTLTLRDVTKQVEVFIQIQLGGDEVVAFKQPEHTRADVIGCRIAKAFIETDVLPGLRMTTKDALASIIVCGAIGVGKTFLWEAVAGELGIPVLVLKNLRSKWFGETDVIFERLRRVLGALSKVLIYIEEADTAFGGVGGDVHETERRLTGKLQGMMSDPRLRGKVHWLLDTARVHLLSADIRRPGRGGDLIFSMFDAEGEDRKDFVRWTVESVIDGSLDDAAFGKIDAATTGYSAGAFNSLRAELRRKANEQKLTIEGALAIVHDVIPPDIGLERRYQTLQAMLNCTRRSLFPEDIRKLEGEAWERQRTQWVQEVAQLEAAGIH